MPHIGDRFTLPPVGTIYWSPVAERAWKVVKRTEKTLWLQELETDTFRGVGGIWHTLPVRGTYASDKKLMRRQSPIDRSIHFGVHNAYIYQGSVREPNGV